MDMAKGIEFIGANCSLGAPPGMDGQVYALPAARIQYPEGMWGYVSCWKFSPEEIERIQENGVLWLHVMSDLHPPIAIETEKPFEEQRAAQA